MIARIGVEEEFRLVEVETGLPACADPLLAESRGGSRSSRRPSDHLAGRIPPGDGGDDASLTRSAGTPGR